MRVPLCLWHRRTAVATVLHLALTAGNSGAAPTPFLLGDELSGMFRDTPNVLHPPVANPESVVSQPADAYDSHAALSTSQMHGSLDVAHLDAMHQGSPSHPTSLQVAHDYSPITLPGVRALSLPSGQMHAMHEHAYGGPALGTHNYAGDELTPAYLPFMRMGSESTKEEEGDLPREVLPHYFYGEHGRPLDDAEIHNLIEQGEAMIQRVQERTQNKRTKNTRTKNTRTKMSYKVIAGESGDVTWMQRVFEARMRQLLPPKEFDEYDSIVMVADEEINAMDRSKIWNSGKRIKEKQQKPEKDVATSSDDNAMLRMAAEPSDRTVNPLNDFTLKGVRFHVMKGHRNLTGPAMLVGNFRVLALFPPNQQGTKIIMSFGMLSIKKKGGDESVVEETADANTSVKDESAGPEMEGRTSEDGVGA